MLFAHDCDKCHSIGEYKGQDAYVCGQTIVLRYGNEPIENKTYPLFVLLMPFEPKAPRCEDCGSDYPPACTCIKERI